MPYHVNPSKDRTATAPYNFVPLPRKAFVVEDGIEAKPGEAKVKPWELHDRFVPGTNSGWIDLTIETLTPLFIRGPVVLCDGKWDQRETRRRPDPCQTADGRPLIPGSSLRGMIRTLVEILSFAKIQPVSDAKPFYRTVAPDRIGRAYRGRLMPGGSKPEGGFLRVTGPGTAEIEVCEVLRVERETLRKLGVPLPSSPSSPPPPSFQRKPCWVERKPGSDYVDAIRLEKPPGDQWEEGTLVLTGHTGNKLAEFVFVRPPEPPERVSVPEHVWDRFHDEDQITQWQEKAFPRNQPSSRKVDGHLCEGEPVFFITLEEGKDADRSGSREVDFLGRAQMFRFPYDLRPSELVPETMRSAGLDLAEAMFGRVNGGAIKGRVSVGDAVATQEGPDCFEEVIVPKILSAPKVTTFQHYLTQDGRKGKDRLTTYLRGDRTTIRGHKLYWHRWDEGQGLAAVREDSKMHDSIRDDLQQQERKPNDTQHTIIRPVKAGVCFTGRIRFENLTDLELGALLSAIELPEGCAHRLGMGKPLGLGSVHLKGKLRLIDRGARYSSWGQDGIRDGDISAFQGAFSSAMLQHAAESNEPMIMHEAGLRRIARLNTLFLLLDWKHQSRLPQTAYMDLGMFRGRPILPTPHWVTGQSEPPWPNDTPAALDAPSGGTPTARPRGYSAAWPTTGERTSPRPASLPTPPPARAKPVQKGQTREGTLQRDGNTWVARFDEDTRVATIVNQASIPAAAPDGGRATFYIVEQSKSGGIQARFEALAARG